MATRREAGTSEAGTREADWPDGRPDAAGQPGQPGQPRARPSSARAGTSLAVVILVALAAGCGDPGRGGAPVRPTSEGSAETPPAPMDVTAGSVIADDLPVPWDVAFLADGTPLVTLRDESRVLRLDAGGPTPLTAPGPDGTVPDVAPRGEGGLLGIAVGPDGAVYLYLTTAVDNRVVRLTPDGDELTDPQVVLAGIPAGTNHNGGRIAFGPDGYLYVGTGDAGRTGNAQDLDSLGGKILRITSHGAPAPGNPFGTAVFSYGHRNVQGLGWAADGRMFASEFGQDTFDELNLVVAGGNYGWPEVEGGGGGPPFTDPLVTWTTDEASPSGIAVTGDAVWVAALRGERLWRAPLTDDGVGPPAEYLAGELGRLRAVVLAPDGDLWAVTNNTDGRGAPRAGADRIVQVDVG